MPLAICPNCSRVWQSTDPEIEDGEEALCPECED